MTTTVLLGKTRVRLDDANLLGEGGEGRVYRIGRGDQAVKLFTTPGPARAAKLAAFPSNLPASVIAPTTLARDPSGQIVGYAMRVVEGAVDLHRFAQRKWRLGRVDNGEVLRTFRAIASTLHELHKSGVIVGDLNDGNVVATPPSPARSGWSPYFLDADSMQFGAFPCPVAHERFLDPKLYGVDLGAGAGALSTATDWYAFAVLLFGSLLFLHPYGGTHPSHPTLLRRAEARCSALHPTVKLPPSAARPDTLPDATLDWFLRTFEKDLREPPPSALLETPFTRCSCGLEHARRQCPGCVTHVPPPPAIRTRGRIQATRIFSTRGRILAVAVEGGRLAHVHEDRGNLVREDGTTLRIDTLAPAFLRDPEARVRISGAATWLLFSSNTTTAGTVLRAIGDTLGPPLSSGLVRGAVAADAGLHGAIVTTGDQLVRAEAGTRVGQILEGQTHVRVGPDLGFAFYRAGAVTVAFVFDPLRGPLRQIEGFPGLAGKLVDWSVAFGAGHALLSFTLETYGRVAHVTHLVDARGTILASASGSRIRPGSALLGDKILSPTDDGLTLFTADPRTRTFVPVRDFPDARDFVQGEIELHPCQRPGGSLYVVSADDIHHLTFQPGP